MDGPGFPETFHKSPVAAILKEAKTTRKQLFSGFLFNDDTVVEKPLVLFAGAGIIAEDGRQNRPASNVWVPDSDYNENAPVRTGMSYRRSMRTGRPIGLFKLFCSLPCDRAYSSPFPLLKTSEPPFTDLPTRYTAIANASIPATPERRSQTVA